MADFTTIPELADWNGGSGISPEAWIQCVGTYELAAAYSLIFWPKFVPFEQYVLRAGFSQKALRGFEEVTSCNRAAVERVMNLLPVANIHMNVERNEAQVRFLGRVLKDIFTVKLHHDFPDRQFHIEFNDEPGVILDEYELTFWQAD